MAINQYGTILFQSLYGLNPLPDPINGDIQRAIYMASSKLIRGSDVNDYRRLCAVKAHIHGMCSQCKQSQHQCLQKRLHSLLEIHGVTFMIVRE